MKYLYVFIFLSISCQVFAQSSKKQPVATADSLAQNKSEISQYLLHMAETPIKSNLSYSTISQFVQSNVTTGANGGLNFKSTIFGLHYLFSKGNDSLSSYYLPHTAGRNTEISLGLNKAGTTSDQFSLVTVGIKFAAINNRDKSFRNFAVEGNLLGDIVTLQDQAGYVKIVYTTKYIIDKIFTDHIKQKDQLDKALAGAEQIKDERLKTGGLHNWTNSDITSVLHPLGIDGAPADTILQEFARLYPAISRNNAAYSSKDVVQKAKVDPEYKEIADAVFAAANTTYDDSFKAIQKKYDDFAKKVELGTLLTFSLNPGYNIQRKHWDTTTFAVRLLTGLGSNLNKPLNIDFQGNIVSLQDSSARPQNFYHNKMKLSLGLNKVIVTDKKDAPLLEGEFAGEYDRVLSHKYAHEKAEVFTANFMASVHLSKEFTLPLTLKYDPKHANLFGFLSVQWNLEDGSKGSAKK